MMNRSITVVIILFCFWVSPVFADWSEGHTKAERIDEELADKILNSRDHTPSFKKRMFEEMINMNQGRYNELRETMGLPLKRLVERKHTKSINNNAPENFINALSTQREAHIYTLKPYKVKHRMNIYPSDVSVAYNPNNRDGNCVIFYFIKGVHLYNDQPAGSQRQVVLYDINEIESTKIITSWSDDKNAIQWQRLGNERRGKQLSDILLVEVKLKSKMASVRDFRVPEDPENPFKHQYVDTFYFPALGDDIDESEQKAETIKKAFDELVNFCRVVE